jgi:predicted amidohydrolase
MITSTNFKLGMGQMLVAGGQVEANLARASQMAAQAAGQGCQIVVLPECLDIGWTEPAASKLAQPIPGKHSDVLCRVAQKEQIYVVAGLTEKPETGFTTRPS